MKVSRHPTNKLEIPPNDKEETDFHYMITSDSSNGSNNEIKKTLSNLYISGKCKIMGSLYNIVHSTPTELPAFSSSPIYMIVGNQFDFSTYETSATKAFMDHFYSILWFTYRKDFPPLDPSQLTTDIGWGCMLRTGQMLVAQGVIRHILGSKWKYSAERDTPFSAYRQILRWFADTPAPSSPYSIHKMVQVNHMIDEQHQKHSLAPVNKPGEWFSPTRVCKILKLLVREHSPEALTMYVPKEGVIYIDRVTLLCTQTELYSKPSPKPDKRNPLPQALEELEGETKFWRPLMILIPLRLGVDRINKLYIPQLKSMLQLPQCLGIIGGRPKQSLYFVGFQDDSLIYLDPHIVRPAATPHNDFLDTYHCTVPRIMPFENIDPSLAIGFYCGSLTEFDSFCHIITKMVNEVSNPLFTIETQSPNYMEYESEEELADVVVL